MMDHDTNAWVANQPGDVLIMTSIRSSLTFALESLSRTSTQFEELERAIEAALIMASRQELEQTVFREIHRVYRRLSVD